MDLKTDMLTDDDPVTWLDRHAVAWGVILTLALFVLAGVQAIGG